MDICERLQDLMTVEVYNTPTIRDALREIERLRDEIERLRVKHLRLSNAFDKAIEYKRR